jgi:peptide/nickel transport system permease protein
MSIVHTTRVPRSNLDAWRQDFLRIWWRLVKQPPALVGLITITLLVLSAVFAPWLATHDPNLQVLGDRLQPPSASHWLGTDELGRDVYSRVIFGSRITLYVVMLVTVIAGPVGLTIGAVSGYVGGWVDTVLMRLTDVFLALPGLILALAFVAAIGPGLENAVIAISLTVWPPIARVARAETLTIRSAEFIDAMRLEGASSARIIIRHVAPLCVSSVIVRVTLNMAGIILMAAGLGFLGLGAQPPTPEWGAMLATARQYLIGYWWVPTVPGTAILAVSLAFNLLGDGLRDALDPRIQ